MAPATHTVEFVLGWPEPGHKGHGQSRVSPRSSPVVQQKAQKPGIGFKKALPRNAPQVNLIVVSLTGARRDLFLFRFRQNRLMRRKGRAVRAEANSVKLLKNINNE